MMKLVQYRLFRQTERAFPEGTPFLHKNCPQAGDNFCAQADKKSTGVIFICRNRLSGRFFYMNCTVSVNTTTIATEIPKMGGGNTMKATGIVRRIDDLGRVVIPKEIRRTLRIREGDPLQMTLAPWEKFCFAVSDLAKRNGWS